MLLPVTVLACTVHCIIMKSVLVLLRRNFVHALTSSAKTAGLRMAPEPCVVHFFDHQRPDNLKDVFEGMCRKQKLLKLIIVILDRRVDPGHSE